MLANEANSYHGPYDNTRGLATVATYLTGASCAVGFLPGCVATNILLGSAWVEQIASGGQSQELTTPALTASSIAVAGQMLGTQKVYNNISSSNKYTFSIDDDILPTVRNTHEQYKLAYGKNPSTEIPNLTSYKFQYNAIDIAKENGFEASAKYLKDYATQYGITVDTNSFVEILDGPDGGKVLGISSKNLIWLRPGLNLESYAKTLCHELGHCFDKMVSWNASNWISEARQQMASSIWEANLGTVNKMVFHYQLSAYMSNLLH